jgi:ABC-type dipeptide/oligopeptide/nickel transport system permease component
MVTLIGASGFHCRRASFTRASILFFNNLSNVDYNVRWPTLIGAFPAVAGNFVADIALTVADPRIRLS